MNQFSDKFDFVIVYISEAHPLEGWVVNIPDQPRVNQPKTMEARFDNAAVLAELIDFPVKMYVDTLANQANNAFGAIPERLAVVADGRVQFIGGPGPWEYSIDKLVKHLSTY